VTSYIRLLFAIARPAALFLFTVSAAIGVAFGGQADNQWLLTRVLVAVVGYVLMSVVVNDLADEKIDRVNFSGAARRPLAAGTATTTTFRAIAVTSGTLALSSAATLGHAVFAVMLAGVALSLSYSIRPIRLSDRGALTSLLLPFGYVAVPFLAGLFATGAAFSASGAIVLGGLYVGFIGRLLLKDLRDVCGDALFGKRTFLVRHGRTTTCAASAACLVAGNVALLAVPGRTPALAIGQLALTGVAVVLLRALRTSHDARRDEWLVSAIAIVGRGMLVSLLAHLSLIGRTNGTVAALVLGLLAVVTIGQAQRMRTGGPRGGTTVPTEWADERTLVAP
jgi:4-hydroxybenzoate polyprenyltransferase